MAIEKGKTGSEENKTPENLLQEFEALKRQIEELKKSQTTNVGEALTSAINSLTSAQKEKELTLGGYVTEADIDPNDHDHQGVTFFNYSVMYAILDDKKQGKSIKTPYGNIILFRYQGNQKIRTGKYTQIVNLSAYTSYSKKEIEWLRNHSLYGVKFFESAKEALNVDHEKAEIIAAQLKAVDSMEAHQIITQAKNLNMDVTGDVRTIRLKLATYYAEREYSNRKSKDNTRAMLENTAKDVALLNSN